MILEFSTDETHVYCLLNGEFWELFVLKKGLDKRVFQGTDLNTAIMDAYSTIGVPQ